METYHEGLKHYCTSENGAQTYVNRMVSTSQNMFSWMIGCTTGRVGYNSTYDF